LYKLNINRIFSISPFILVEKYIYSRKALNRSNPTTFQK